MMMWVSSTAKKGSERIAIDWKKVFSFADPDPHGDDFCFVSPSSAERKGKAKGNTFTTSPGYSLDFYPVSPSSAPAKGQGKRRREEEAEYSGRPNDALRRDIEGMSDGELQREIADLITFGSRLGREKRERRQRLLPLLENEARRRRIRTDAAKDGDGCNRGAHSSEKSLYTFDIEDLQMEYASRKYFPKSSPIRSTRKNFGWVGVQTCKSPNQTGPRKPITVDNMCSSKTSPTALCGSTQRVHAVDPKEHDNEKSQQNDNNYCRNYAKRRSKSSVGDAIIVDDDASSDDDEKRNPTPNSVATTKTPDGRKHAKENGKKTEDDDIKESLNVIMNARKEMDEEMKIMKMKEMQERTAAEQRKAVAEERRAAAEERMAAAEERRVALEERKVAMEESLKAIEQEQKLMFMDTSHLDAKQKAYVELCRDQVLAKRSMSMMGGFMGAMGGFMGAMGGFMGSMGGAMGGMGGGSNANGGMAGGFGSHDAMGGGFGAHGSKEATQNDEATHGDASDANAVNVN